MVSITPLNPFTAARFADFTWTDHGARMGRFGPDPSLIALGATRGDNPVGLAVGRVNDDGSGRVISVYVRQDCRRQGIGGRLLHSLENTLAARGCTRFEVRYTLDTDGTEPFERLLVACGWPSAGERLHVFLLDGQIMTAPWFQAARLPPNYEVAPWLTVTQDERRDLVQPITSELWVPEPLRPDRFETDVHEITSLVLRREGRVIGWVLTSPLDATTIHYRNLYVQPSCNRVGRTFAALALLAEAVRRQERAMGVRSRGRFEVAWHNHGFLRFIDRHFSPDLLSRTVMQRVAKLPIVLPRMNA